MKRLNLKSNLLVLLAFITASIYGYAQQGNVSINQDKKITSLMEIRKDMNKNESTSDRYRIQVYSGNRASAESTQADFSSKFSNWEPTIMFETPNYKVWAGNFRNRLEADRALKEIKQKFPSAFIFKPKK